MQFLSSLASSFRAVPDSDKVSLPSWLFWVLLIVVVALVAGLLIRDKALRNKVAAGLNKLKKKWIRARLRGKIKKGQRTLDEAMKRLGQAAWTAGYRPEASGEAVRELNVLHETIQAKNDEIAKIEAEASGTKQVQAEFLQSQKARIDKQVEAARPHRDELSGRQARLKEVAHALDDTEKTMTGAESEIRTAEKELAGIEADAAMEAGRKQACLTETRNKIESSIRKKADAADRGTPLRAEKASIMEAAAKVQAIIDGYDKAIKGLGDELSEKIRTSEAQVAEMDKKKSALKAEIDETEKKKHPHWAALGKTLNEKRVDDPALASIYAEIDGIDKTIRENEARHKDLGGS
jgi:chromosome segregation ATPase